MASVCGGCLALQDAGVPVKCSIAGIAMGMVLDTKEFGGDGTPLILSDILGSEDASGDMDFKVLLFKLFLSSSYHMFFEKSSYIFMPIHPCLKVLVIYDSVIK